MTLGLNFLFKIHCFGFKSIKTFSIKGKNTIREQTSRYLIL